MTIHSRTHTSDNQNCRIVKGVGIMRKLDLGEKILCNTVSKAFNTIANEKQYNEANLCIEWLKSETFARLFDMDETLICQSARYIANDIINEFGNTLPQKHGTINGPALSWFGYISLYMALSENITGKSIEEEYDIENILADYDTLHTMSVKAAIQEIENSDTKVARIRDKLFSK